MEKIEIPPDTRPLNWMRPDVDVQAELPLYEMPVTPEILAGFPKNAGEVRLYKLGDCSVIVTREFGLWHLSIAHPQRNPTWEEISGARYRILPDNVTMGILLPPRSEYVNVHRYCFQMVEIKPERIL